MLVIKWQDSEIENHLKSESLIQYKIIGCHQEQVGKAKSRWETGWAIRRGRVEMMGRLETMGT